MTTSHCKNMTTEYFDVEQRTPEWFNLRRGLITASQVPALLGVDEYKTKNKAINEIAYGIKKDLSKNPAVNHGVVLEDEARKHLEIVLNREIKPCGFFVYDGWLGGSPDGLVVGKNAIIEIKCPYSGGNMEWKESYFLQCKINMFLTGASRCHLYIYMLGGDRIFTIDRDDALIKTYIPILKQIKMEIDNYKMDTSNLYKSLLRYKDLNDEIKELEEIKDKLKAEIEKNAGEIKNCGEFKLSSVVRTGNLNYKAFCADKNIIVDESYRGETVKYFKITY